MDFQRVLGIETSCDDTSVAIVKASGEVEVCVSASQDSVHADFGGVVPEIASRNHSYHLLPLVELALQKASLTWDEIDGIAVTCQPGLIGSLLVGVVTAKTLAMSKSLPFLGVNHLEGHLLAPFLYDQESKAPSQKLDYPYLALAVSGGHTSLYLVKNLGEYEVLGTTIDDAAGEAFDKFAKMAGLGYPGGVQVDRLSQGGEEAKYSFPRAMMQKKNKTYNFSFSGLKTSAQLQLSKMSLEEKRNEISHLCASYQEAIVDALLTKMDWAMEEFFISKKLSRKAILTGGVSANSRLRKRAEEWAEKKNVQLVVPPLRYCTDNAAMIAYAGIQRLNRGERSGLDLAASPHSQLLETN